MKNIILSVLFCVIATLSLQAQFPGGVSATSTNELWLDAFQRGGTDGAIMSTWPDESGNGNHAVASSTSRRPIYRASGVNGMPAIDFDGVDDYMEVASNSDFNSNLSSHFIVFESSSLNSVILI